MHKRYYLQIAVYFAKCKSGDSILAYLIKLIYKAHLIIPMKRILLDIFLLGDDFVEVTQIFLLANYLYMMYF